MKPSDILFKALYCACSCPFGSLYSLKTHGKENLPRGRGILVANHTSYLDPFFIIAGVASKEPIHFCTLDFYKHARPGLNRLKAGAMNLLLSLNGQIVLDEDKMNREAFRKIKNVLENERYLGVFAEGKRSHDGKLDEFKDGAAYIALKTQSPLVPICLNGSYEIWKRGTYFPKLSGSVEMRIGKPIIPCPSRSKNLRRDAYDLSELVRQEILKLSLD